MAENIRIRFEGTFDSHNVKRDGVVKLGFKAPLSEIASVIQLVRLIDDRISIGIICEGTDIPVGRVSLDRLSFDRHGEARIVVESDVDKMRISEEHLRAVVDKPLTIVMIGKGGG